MNNSRPSWTLISSHGTVLVYVSNHPEATIREIAREVELTERRVMELLKDLSDAKLITIERTGRRNAYQVRAGKSTVHPDVPVSVADFLRLSKTAA